jgi:hypothetical protein
MNDFVDFLITRGFIPKLPGIKRVENQIQTGVSLNHPGLGIMPQAGPFAKILTGGKASAGPELGTTAIASGESFAFPLIRRPRNKFLGIGTNKLVGPASTFISSKITKEMDNVVVHESKHAFDNMSVRLRPDSEILPSLLRARDEKGNVLNAASEASGKTAEAILANGIVRPYGRLDIFDPEELIPNFALNPDRIRNFLTTYLVPSASSMPSRWYQYGSDWVKLYKESISLNEKHYGIKIHDEATMDGLQRAQEFFELSKFSIPHPTNGRANVASIIKAIADYDGMHQNVRVLAIDNLVQEATKLGVKLRVPSLSSIGKPSSPEYFKDGGFVARGTDTVPAMLSPGEYVIKSQRVKELGTNLFDNINSGSLSSVQSMSSPSFSSGSSSVSVNQSSVPSRQAAASSSNSVYNYSLSVNVASQSDPNTIAQTVMAQLQRVDSQRVRNGRF